MGLAVCETQVVIVSPSELEWELPRPLNGDIRLLLMHEYVAFEIADNGILCWPVVHEIPAYEQLFLNAG